MGRQRRTVSLGALVLAAVTLVLGLAALPAGAAEHDAPSAEVTFHDQATDGTEVLVESVTMSEGGFVVIHDRQLYTGPVEDSVVGVSQVLDPGTHEDVQVPLDPPIEEGQALIAMPHLDSDGDGRFAYFETDRQEDWAYQRQDGQGAVTDEAEIEVEAQAPGPAAGLVTGLLAATAVIVYGRSTGG